MHVSVVIITNERKKLLKNLIDSILSQKILPKEILIIDASKELFNPGLLKTKIPVHVIKDERKSIPYARNLGVQKAKGDIIFFVDDDCILHSNTLEQIHNHFKNYPSTQIVVGKTENGTPKNVYAAVQHAYYERWLRQAGLQFKNVQPLPTGSLMDFEVLAGKKKFLQQYLFDEHLPFGRDEDAELGARIFKGNAHLSFNPAIKVDHIPRQTLLSLVKRNLITGYCSEFLKNERDIVTKPIKTGTSVPWREIIQKKQSMYVKWLYFLLLLRLYPLFSRLGRYAYRTKKLYAGTKTVTDIMHHVINSGIIRWALLLGLYFSVLHILITSTSDQAVFLYVGLLLFTLFSCVGDIIHMEQNDLLLLGGFISSFIYAYLAPAINRLELWGDEIEEIRIATFSFGEIYRNVKLVYFDAPPFGFWNLWIWNHFVMLTKVQYHELFYRIPYMATHTLSSIIFGILTLKIITEKEKNIHLWKRILVFCVSSLTFFTNPVLFFYSIEVRFYAIAILGSLIALYFYIFRSAFQRKHIFLLFFFCLNSITQFVVLLPVWISLYIFKKKDRFFTVLGIVTTGVLAFIIENNITSPKPTSFSESLRLITTALSLFYSLQFSFVLQIIFLGLVVIFLIRNRDKKILSIGGWCIFFIFITCFMGFIEKYYDFHVRHLSYAIPWMIILFFVPLLYLNKGKQIIYLQLVIVLFTIPWTLQTYKQLTTQNVFSKTLLGTKKITKEANAVNAEIILLPNYNTKRLPPNVYDFYQRSFNWYADQYDAPFSESDNTEEGCNKLTTQKNVFLLSLTDNIDCADNIPQQYIYGTTYKTSAKE